MGRFLVSWREARSSISEVFQLFLHSFIIISHLAKLSITHSFFELQTPDFAWKFVWKVQTNTINTINTRNNRNNRNIRNIRNTRNTRKKPKIPKIPKNTKKYQK